ADARQLQPRSAAEPAVEVLRDARRAGERRPVRAAVPPADDGGGARGVRVLGMADDAADTERDAVAAVQRDHDAEARRGPAAGAAVRADIQDAGLTSTGRRVIPAPRSPCARRRA